MDDWEKHPASPVVVVQMQHWPNWVKQQAFDRIKSYCNENTFILSAVLKFKINSNGSALYEGGLKFVGQKEDHSITAAQVWFYPCPFISAHFCQ